MELTWAGTNGSGPAAGVDGPAQVVDRWAPGRPLDAPDVGGVGSARLRLVRAASTVCAPTGGRILLVDQSDLSRRNLRVVLEEGGFEVAEASGGRQALASVAAGHPDLVLVDVHLADMDGFEVLCRIRAHHNTPVIFLTADAVVEDRVAALDAGADDYILKPFAVDEVLARVRALLRRSTPASGNWGGGEFGELTIDGWTRQVRVLGKAVPVTRREFDLLATLAREPGRVFTRGQLLEQVWRSRDDWQDPATVTEHVHRLRAKIEPDPARPQWIGTVRHLGYTFSWSPPGELCPC